jgi:hypothetical protein
MIDINKPQSHANAKQEGARPRALIFCTDPASPLDCPFRLALATKLPS